MKAVQIVNPSEMKVVELEKPAVGAGEVLVRIKYVGFCGSDLNTFLGRNPVSYTHLVDHQTLEDNCVTLRNRDTMQQERVAISELNNIIADRVSITSLLKTLQ